MKKILVFSLILATIFSITSCIKEDKSSINKAIWSSANPLDIPLKRRQNEFVEGNKVFNPSFENGRFFRDNVDTYEIDGWKEIGESEDEVFWVDTTHEEFNKNDVYRGVHAIRIHNEKTDETEVSGAGIISDYIRVIPGNYRLSYYIKLKNICSNKSRFGNRLMDAINVRVHFYDKNKIEISEDMINPEDGRKFDNGFKAFQLAGFWNIDSLPWTKTLGIAHKFPFFDGDIPDEARYVRLFFGLKGKGTMWVDDVSFEYTQHNFSLSERLMPYKRKEFTKYDLLLPEPKNVQPGEELKIYNPVHKSKKPLIVIPEQADKLTLHAAGILEEKLKNILKNNAIQDFRKVSVVKYLEEEKLDEYSIVFSLGDNLLNKRNSETLPYSQINNHHEGYFIERLEDTLNVISIAGINSIGNYYGIQTLTQLLPDTGFSYHHADIIDYPSFEGRGIYINADDTSLESNLENLLNLRYNEWYINANRTKNFNEYKKLADRVMSVKPEHIPVKTGISINPYLFPYKNRDDHSPSIKNQSAIKKHIEYSFARDFSSVLLRMDSTLNADEMCECDFRFDKWNGNHLHYRSLVDIHTEFINSVSEWTSEDADIKFMPVWYKNDCIRRSHGKGEAYLEEIFRRIPGDVNYLWTGGSEHPIVIDNIEEERIVKITGKEPVLFIKDINPFSCEDESGLHKRYAPGKLRMSSIFEHFELYLADEFYNSERRASVITEDSPADFWDIIKLSTLANYLWNAEEFNPDLSLLKVLTSYFGKEKAFALIEFNELYQGIYEMCIKINIQGKKKRFIRSAEEFFVQMNNLLDDLDNLFEDPVIQKELILRKEKVEELYNRTIQG